MGDKPVIEGYEIISEIDRGGLSIVYKALQKVICQEGEKEADKEREVALKVIKQDISEDFILRFLSGTRLLLGLNHPYIVKVFDTGMHDGRRYLSMEYIQGKDLDDLIYHDDEFNLAKGVPILIKTLDGLGYAHKKQINHNDIKPQNILVDDSGSPHIIDFDLARKVNEPPEYPTQGIVLGTFGYLSPERLVGPGETDPRSDIFSVGVILYELLTRMIPYERDGRPFCPFEELLIPPRQLNSNAPEKLENICIRAIECDINKRYQTAEEFSDALKGFLARS